MPEVSRFYGMIIKMFFRKSEHNPPHIHVLYGEYAGLIDIETGEMFEGDLPVRALALAKEWAQAHKGELLEMWRTQNFKRLPPLE
ncbi:MAG: DUF4160 domain-containing protein [Spirochaetaceae bacterium]|jgi:hypothetical protein|nr:DUF4160 domain-containing protein [Spirochaetaceae bacterium]